ncbi:MAG TPA: DUF2147 domain-containing protein [Gemmatimonadaceae bacterium]|nr:DUF2147 domain-containing protein [Gemmatimonadaceae bacterium]
MIGPHMRHAAVGLALALGARGAHAQSASTEGDAIVGTWLTSDSSSKVQIVSSGGTYSGTVVWLKAATAVDSKNSDASLRSRPVMGIAILSGFSYKGSDVWEGGKVYSPRRGNSYDGVLTLNKDGTLSVKAKSGLGSKTVVWRRA